MREMIEITLPEHDILNMFTGCYCCDGPMGPATVSEMYTVDNIDILVSGIKAYVCMECGEIVYTASEARMIEDAIREKIGR